MTRQHVVSLESAAENKNCIGEHSPVMGNLYCSSNVSSGSSRAIAKMRRRARAKG